MAGINDHGATASRRAPCGLPYRAVNLERLSRTESHWRDRAQAVGELRCAARAEFLAQQSQRPRQIQHEAAGAVASGGEPEGSNNSLPGGLAI